PLCMAIGLGWRVKEPPMAVQAFVSLDWKVMKELRVGDTMHTSSRIVSKRPMREGGLIVDERTILDQHGEVVQQGRFTVLVAKRQKEASACRSTPDTRAAPWSTARTARPPARTSRRSASPTRTSSAR